MAFYYKNDNDVEYYQANSNVLTWQGICPITYTNEYLIVGTQQDKSGGVYKGPIELVSQGPINTVKFPNSTSCSLSKIDNREPNEEEKARHKDLTQWIRNQVWENKDIRMVLKWQQGDLAVPDLYKLAHSVSGGFTKNQRTLSGQFGRALPTIEGVC